MASNNEQSGLVDLASADQTNNNDESYWDSQAIELLASADRGADPSEPFPLGTSGAGSPCTPSSSLPFLTTPSYLSSASILPTSTKRARLRDSISSQKNGISADVDGCDRSTANLLEPTWIAEALLELDSVVRDGTNTTIKKRQATCRCTKSKCLKMYCSCYSSGVTCTPFCSCAGCENTHTNGIENHPPKCNCMGCRSVKIETSLRVAQGVSSESQSCLCKSSRCLQLYCGCFQSGAFCSPSCRCIDCFNTPSENDENGAREAAIKDCLRRRSDAFDIRPKGTAEACSCKTNR